MIRYFCVFFLILSSVLKLNSFKVGISENVKKICGEDNNDFPKLKVSNGDNFERGKFPW